MASSTQQIPSVNFSLISQYTQKTAIAKLRDENPKHAVPLLADNPPTVPAPPLPIITLLTCGSITVIMLAFLTLLSLKGEYVFIYIFLIAVAISPTFYGFLEFTKYRANIPQPRSPLPVEMHTETLQSNWFGNNVGTNLIYHYPILAKNIAEQKKDELFHFNNIIRLEFSRAMVIVTHEAARKLQVANDQERAKLEASQFTKIPDANYLEYLLTPRYGRAAYEAGLELFRFEITTFSMPAGPTAEEDTPYGVLGTTL